MKKNIYCYLIALIIFSINPAFAKEELFSSPPENPIPDSKKVFNLVYENDVFNNRDEGYTNGIRFAWLSSEKQISEKDQRDINKLFLLPKKGKKRISIAVGQNMFTPKNISDPNLIKSDRPYAGWLYGSYGIISDTDKTLDSIMLTLGVVGPLSGAEQTQKLIHRNMDSNDPKGWGNQLNTEPGIILSYEKKWRNILQFTPNKFGFDITPDAGAQLGNIYTDASAGTTIRIGFDLPQDYGPPRVRPSLPGSDFFIPSESLGGYFFAGAHGRAVARNIFLDGNSFETSHRVDKKPLVGELQAGVAVTYKDWRTSYTQIFLTKEFYGQDKPQRFGALSVSYRF